ncbi:SIS domain-containing protein [Nonomuraea roseoviolacea]|uniref:D-sedoheptulose 7-phosphate isomerase n=1 Tax=Nonomuraea roseoviolacea subsp. carminata TaxID=160689 RepID=A0ABT1KBV5_9ACTN|nr:SIS domain-containing protein [Nonomuraea roseoviolacea]MCP2351177.1 D-sedoheptulose 7-phosphate isomerase [Nonomuraea roseoviolacea subsp. carminata]
MAIEPGTPENLLERAAARRTAPGRALARDAGSIAAAARGMAARFRRGGRLVTFGDGAAAADAGHVAVEFTHPVIVGKRALPAISLAGDAAALGGPAGGNGPGAGFAAQVRTFGRPGDIALGVLTGEDDRRVREGLAAARELGMLTVALTAAPPAASPATSPGGPPATSPGGPPATSPGGAGRAAEEAGSCGPVAADHVLTAWCDDPLVARELHMTAYHLLWELVHVVLDEPEEAPPQEAPPQVACDTGGGTCVTCSDTAVPVHVTELRPGGLALVDTGEGVEEVSVALVQARVGDVVLVHAKEAIAVLGGGDGS